MQTPPQRLTLSTVFLLTVPPLLWAGNAVVGRLVRELVSPLTLNFVRWVIAFALLLPLAWTVLRPASPMWAHWKRYALLGLLGIGSYNAFQYLALQTSTPINVTLVGSSVPLWMLATGAIFFGARIGAREIAGALLSMLGVLLVLCRGVWRQLLGLQLVPGDLIIFATDGVSSSYSDSISSAGNPQQIAERILDQHAKDNDDALVLVIRYLGAPRA